MHMYDDNIFYYVYIAFFSLLGTAARGPTRSHLQFVMRQYKSIMHLPPIMQTTKWITKMDPIGWAQPKMCADNTRVYEESLSTMKQRTQEGCHDTRQGAQCSRKFLNEIYLAHQGWHISCDKFSNHTDNLNLQV
jgi:hypothetical protein